MWGIGVCMWKNDMRELKNTHLLQQGNQQKVLGTEKSRIGRISLVFKEQR